jgi:hypothetical protein
MEHGIQKALKWCEKEGDPLEEQVAALNNALATLGDRHTGDWLERRVQTESGEELIPAAAAERCKQIAILEAERLPKDVDEEKLARLRFPRNHSERLLRGGLSLKDVTTQAAFRVLEQWAAVLRPFASPEDLPQVLALFVHERTEDMLSYMGMLSYPGGGKRDEAPKQECMREAHVQLEQPTIHRATGSLIRALPNVAQSGSHPLGAALRRVTPLPTELSAGRRWEWMSELSRCFGIEEEVDTAWMCTAERGPGLEFPGSGGSGLDKGPRRHGDLLARASTASLRRTSPAFTWATFQADRGTRSTLFMNCSPQVLSSDSRAARTRASPGPGHYDKPPTRARSRGHFPAVGRRRAANGEASLSQIGRWFFPGGPVSI